MAREKTADLRIRAKDESSATLIKAKGALDAFNAAAQRTAQRRSVVGAQKQEVDAVRQSYVALTADIRRLQEAQDRMRGSGRADASMLRENAEAIALVRSRAREAVQALAAKRNEMQRLGASTQNSFAAFSRNADAMRKQSAATGQAGAAIRQQSEFARQNADALGKLNRETARLATTQRQAQIQIAKTNSAMSAQGSAARGRGAKQNWGSSVIGEDQEVMAFGLRPYQLTNLSYQVNDVVSGMAMGQPIMQIFAQQVGQIMQIFPAFARGMMGIFRFLETYWRLLGPIAAAVGVVFSVMRKEAQEAAVITQFATELAMLADGANYAAEGLASIVKEARNAGMAMTDAQSAVSTFVRAGFAQSRIPEMIDMTRQLAKVTGDDVPTAARKLADAFSGGIDGVRELDKEMNFLTASQYATIRAMEDAGMETEALDLATKILSDTLDTAAGKAGEGGPWSRAFRNVGDAWNYALGWFQNTLPIQLAIGAVNALGEAVAILTSMLPNGEAAKVSAGSSSRRRGRGNSNSHSNNNIPPSNISSLLKERELLLSEQLEKIESNASKRGASSRREKADRLRQELLQIQQAIREERITVPIPVTLQPEITSTGDAASNAAAEEESAVKAKERIDSLREINRLLGTQKADLAEQARLSTLTSREQFVQRELARLQTAATERNVTLSAEQTAQLRAQAEATYDALEAERERNRGGGGGGSAKDPVAEERKRLEQEMNDILEYRKSLLEELDFQQSQGNTEAVDRIKQQLEGVNQEAAKSIDNMIAFLGTLSGPGIEAAILNLQKLRRELGQMAQDSIVTADQVNDMLASGMAKAFDRFAEAVDNGKNVIKSLRDAFLQFAADFLREIAQMIIKQALLNALKNAFGGSSGGVGGIISGAVNALLKHTGGQANTGRTRTVNPAIFANANRFHGGGIAGLGPREVPAILLEDEEVLTSNDPRHSRNGGAAGSPNVNVKNVNVFDASDMLERALSTRTGEQVLMNFIGRNSRQVKGAIG